MDAAQKAENKQSHLLESTELIRGIYMPYLVNLKL